jgi:hypothetical protein
MRVDWAHCVKRSEVGVYLYVSGNQHAACCLLLITAGNSHFACYMLGLLAAPRAALTTACAHSVLLQVAEQQGTPGVAAQVLAGHDSPAACVSSLHLACTCASACACATAVAVCSMRWQPAAQQQRRVLLLCHAAAVSCCCCVMLLLQACSCLPLASPALLRCCACARAHLLMRMHAHMDVGQARAGTGAALAARHVQTHPTPSPLQALAGRLVPAAAFEECCGTAPTA